jgi:hypothetical protein
MGETSGVLDYAIVKINDANVKAAREFMEAFEVNTYKEPSEKSYSSKFVK